MLLSVLISPLRRLSIQRERHNSIFQDEIVHQMRFAADREKLFIGRAQLLKTVSFQIDKNAPPRNCFIFIGSSGCGKSSFLSKLAIVLQRKFGMIPIIRFCGTTKITSQKDALIHSVISQIELLFKLRFRLLENAQIYKDTQPINYNTFIQCEQNPWNKSDIAWKLTDLPENARTDCWYKACTQVTESTMFLRLHEFLQGIRSLNIVYSSHSFNFAFQKAGK